MTVLTQPTNPNQVCTVSNGSGTIVDANISNVSVTCVDMFSIGGSASGLTMGNSVVLQNNGGDDLTVDANGGFTFTTLPGDTSTYNVTILTQVMDPDLTCFLSNASGTISSANISDVALDCYPNLDVTPFSAGNGTIDPSTVVENVPQGNSTQFTLEPISSHMPGPVTGTCPTGTLINYNDGTWRYTTGSITEDCTVIANFEPGVPVITEGDSVGVTMDEDSTPTAFSLTLNATDPNNDTISWSITSNPSKGTATASGNGPVKAYRLQPLRG